MYFKELGLFLLDHNCSFFCAKFVAVFYSNIPFWPRWRNLRSSLFMFWVHQRISRDFTTMGTYAIQTLFKWNLSLTI